MHRDVAPDNIMLTRDEQGLPLVKVIDLGIAKVAEGPIEATATGVFLGKLKYASPEQYGALPKGQRLDGRSDLYGLGVVLYEILTGVLPFEGDTVVELLRAHVFAPPRPFSQSDPEGRVPAELRGAILKSLQKRREDRYATAEEFDREILTIRSRLRPSRGPRGDARGRRNAPAEPGDPRAVGDAERPKPPRPAVRGFWDADARALDRERFDRGGSGVRPMDGPRGRRRRRCRPSPGGCAAGRRGSCPPFSLVTAAIAAIAVLSRSKRAEAPFVPGAAALATPAAVPTLPERPTAEPSPLPTAEPTAVPPTPPPTAVPASGAPARSRADRRAPNRSGVAAGRGAAAGLPASVPPPAPTPAAEAVRLPSPVPAVPTEPQRAAVAAPSPSARPAPTDADRLREAVRLYETAQNTLNPDLYVRVFPGVDRSRIQEAFGELPLADRRVRDPEDRDRSARPVGGRLRVRVAPGRSQGGQRAARELGPRPALREARRGLGHHLDPLTPRATP